MGAWRWRLAGVLWGCAVLGGFAVLLRYKSTAAAPPEAPAVWPAMSTLARGADRPTLIMFVHPHCACSRASVSELGKLLARVRDRVSAEVVFVRPDGAAPGWERTPLREAALALPGVTVVDDHGVQARLFGAATSGTCLLYDRGGRLQFAGGITALRGHEGNSFGQERIVALLTQGAADRRDSPVFGCPLRDPPQEEE